MPRPSEESQRVTDPDSADARGRRYLPQVTRQHLPSRRNQGPRWRNPGLESQAASARFPPVRRATLEAQQRSNGSGRRLLAATTVMVVPSLLSPNGRQSACGSRSDRLCSSLELGSKCRSSDACGPLQAPRFLTTEKPNFQHDPPALRASAREPHQIFPRGFDTEFCPFMKANSRART